MILKDDSVFTQPRCLNKSTALGERDGCGRQPLSGDVQGLGVLHLHLHLVRMLLGCGLQAGINASLGAVVVALTASGDAIRPGVILRHTQALPHAVNTTVVRAVRGESLLQARLTGEAGRADANAVGAASIAAAVVGAGTAGAEVASVAGLAHASAVLSLTMLADRLIAVNAGPRRNAAADARSTA